MKAFTVATILASTAAASDYFSAISVRSGSPVHLLPLTASGQRLHLGGTTAGYCPENVEQQGGCPPPSGITDYAATDGGLSLGAVVPGGQQVFVDAKTGAVGYTQAHSASVPEGALRTGWTWDSGAGSANGLGSLAFQYGLLACPSKSGVYDIHAQVPGVMFTGDCLGFAIVTSNSTGPSQWQYL